jgi:hypothetical protein
LEIKVLHEGVHSGDASGVVTDSFRVLRQLLDRLEDSETGQMKEELHVNYLIKRWIFQWIDMNNVYSLLKN